MHTNCDDYLRACATAPGSTICTWVEEASTLGEGLFPISFWDQERPMPSLNPPQLAY